MSSLDGTPEASRASKLAMNAGLYRYDPLLEKWADMFSTDVEAWQKLSVLQQDRSGAYFDARGAYRAAVAAGAIEDDRSPHTAKRNTSSW